MLQNLLNKFRYSSSTILKSRVSLLAIGTAGLLIAVISAVIVVVAQDLSPLALTALIVLALLSGSVHILAVVSLVVSVSLTDVKAKISEVAAIAKNANKNSKLAKEATKSKSEMLRRELDKGLDHLYAQMESKESINTLLEPKYPITGLSGWALTPDSGLLLTELILESKPDTFVDLGSGLSTVLAAYAMRKNGKGKVISVEHDETFYKKTLNLVKMHELEEWVELCLAPLKNHQLRGEEYKWYDLSRAEVGKIDVLLIDGPPGKTQKFARYPALPILDKHLADQAVIILDDYGRDEEQEIVQRWLKEYPHFTVTTAYTKKKLAILRKG